MNKNIIIGIIVVVILAAGGVIAYKSMKPSEMAPAPDNSMMAASPASTDMMMGSDASMSASMSGAMDQGAVKEFTVTGSNYKFEPSTLTVNKGDKVKITFKNSGGFHNWILDEFNAKTKTIQADATDTVEFTADKVGSFEYYCGVGNHRAMGMKGTLTVQ